MRWQSKGMNAHNTSVKIWSKQLFSHNNSDDNFIRACLHFVYKFYKSLKQILNTFYVLNSNIAL